MKNKEDLLTLSPMPHYKKPDLPTYEENKPNLASKLPNRWKSKAVLATVTGILGVSTLTGCTIFESEPAVSNYFSQADCGEEDWFGTLSNFKYDLCIRSHHGGAHGPIYVAHLTEQEVFGIISSRLEAVGLHLNDEVPRNAVEDFWGQIIAIDLFDSQHNVGVVHLSWLISNQPFSARERAFSTQIAESFAEQTHDVTIGVFNTPGQMLGWGSEDAEINAGLATDIRSELLADLDEQLDAFIDQLQEEGVID